MNTLRLFLFCSFLLLLSSNTSADARQQNGSKTDERSAHPTYRSGKMASRAKFSRWNENSNAKSSPYNSQEHQKLQLSKDEKEMLRRQVNEAGSLYSKKK